MTPTAPTTDLDARYGDPEATARSWEEAADLLARAEVSWLTTVRPDGRPHVTPLITVWLDASLFFCTGPDERKALNLAENPHCVLTTGRNDLHAGLDLVLEGDAVRVTEEGRLRALAAAYEAKYGSEWHFDVGDGVFLKEGNPALVFEVRPLKAWGFGREPLYSATRWTFR